MGMDNYEYFHEKEVVQLKALTPLYRKDLHEYLMSKGFKSEDEFYYLDRDDKAKPWQSISVLSIDIFLGDDAIYETKEDIEESEGSVWDRLEASYLMASLPENYIENFCNNIFKIAEKFGLSAYHNNTEKDKKGLIDTFMSYAKELSENYSKPGSEDLAIFIQDTYPR